MFENQPKGLYALALANTGERFGYYTMLAIFVLFLQSNFGWGEGLAGTVYSTFLMLVYFLPIVGGAMADKIGYGKCVTFGILVMFLGYFLLAIPAGAGTLGIVLMAGALLMICVGTSLFKGNLQAIVGQMYDDLEAEAAKKGEKELIEAKSKRDSGFQIFYVFINIGGLIAPFIAPLLRSWWLSAHDMVYNASLPALCHDYIAKGAEGMSAEAMGNLNQLMSQCVGETSDMAASCAQYLQVFNEGIHYSFVASVAEIGRAHV